MVVVCSPTKALVDQTATMLRGAGGKHIHCIHEDCSKNIQGDIRLATKDIAEAGCGALLITNASFDRIQYFHRPIDWDLIIDEIPRYDTFYELSIPRKFGLLTKYIELGEYYGPGLHCIKLRDKKAAAQFVERFANAWDQIENLYVGIIASLLGGDECFVDTKSWNKIVEDQDITPDREVNMEYGNERNKLYFLSLLAPHRFLEFKSTTILGANIPQSMIYRGWQDRGIEFVEHKNITRHLRYNAYQQGKRLAIKYQQEEPHSKYSGKQIVNGRKRLTVYDQEAMGYFWDKPFLYVANNDQNNLIAPNSIRMPVCSNGLNSFVRFDNIYFSAALNRRSKHLGMLYTLGFDATYITRATMHETVHQSIMRTSLRNLNSTTTVTTIVTDRPSAEALARLFPGCSIGPLNGLARRVKKTPLSDYDRTKNSRISKLLIANGLQKHCLTEVGTDNTQNDTDPPVFRNSAIILGKDQHPVVFTRLNSIHEKPIQQVLIGSLMEVKALLKALSKEVVRSKDEYALFSATTRGGPAF